ncbi:4HBT domain containing protein, partial [Asbolus verrucosus]
MLAFLEVEIKNKATGDILVKGSHTKFIPKALTESCTKCFITFKTNGVLIKILSVGDGKCLAQLKVDDDHINPMGGLHGGMSASLMDCVSSYALMSKVGPTFRHVSVDIHLNYLKTAKINDDLLIDASVVKRGDPLAFLQAEIKNKATGDLRIISIGEGKLKAELKVDDGHTNPMGGLHGGMSATLVDTLSTFALMSKLGEIGPNARHVSVDIHMSYLKGAKVGDEILIEAGVVRSGKSVAFLEAEIRNKATGDLLVKASHTKFIM